MHSSEGRRASTRREDTQTGRHWLGHVEIHCSQSQGIACPLHLRYIPHLCEKSLAHSGISQGAKGFQRSLQAAELRCVKEGKHKLSKVRGKVIVRLSRDEVPPLVLLMGCRFAPPLAAALSMAAGEAGLQEPGQPHQGQ